MSRELSVGGWARRDPSVRWGVGAALIVVWVAVAWADVRILLGLPLVAAALAVLYRRRAGRFASAEDDEDWF